MDTPQAGMVLGWMVDAKALGSSFCTVIFAVQGEGGAGEGGAKPGAWGPVKVSRPLAQARRFSFLPRCSVLTSRREEVPTAPPAGAADEAQPAPRGST